MVNLQTVSTTQRTTTLKTTTFPCTVVGVRWSIGFRGNITTAGDVFWIIVVVPDGEAVNAIATSDGADMYTPEQNVIAFGTVAIADADQASGPSAQSIEGTTKTMRKLKSGDQLMFSAISTSANDSLVQGTVQFFCKS